ncbi:MAG TPA: DUF4870 domain-containing protein [Streptosporangiaceae bacterium]
MQPAAQIDAGPPSGADPASRREVHTAMLAYLGVPFTLCLLPLALYLANVRNHSFARWHAGQALNVAVTALLYTVCGLIVGGVLALDSVQVGTLIAVPLLAVLWISVLVVLVRAASAAGRGEQQPVPRWLRINR